MAVEKMTMVKVTGPAERFEEIAGKLFKTAEFQPENAAKVVGEKKGSLPFTDKNPYASALGKVAQMHDLPEFAGEKDRKDFTGNAEEYVLEVKNLYDEKKAGIEKIKAEIKENKTILDQLEYMADINENLEELFTLEFTRMRFGRLKKGAYEKLGSYLSELAVIYVKGKEDEDYVYGMYLTPHKKAEEIDGVFESLGFERIIISGKASGTPREATEKITAENKRLSDELKSKEEEFKKELKEVSPKINDAYLSLKHKSDVFEMKKHCIHTAGGKFVMTGWTSKKDFTKIKAELKGEDVAVETVVNDNFTPPVRLKNWRIFKPFEFMVKMYSLPKSDEIDPTPIMAVTYMFVFGMMFGDIGQGILLTIFGWLFYKYKKAALGGIMALVGLSATFFGILYGSAFGIEFEAIWIKPAESTTSILISAIVAGAVLILSAMCVNLINAVKTRDWGRFFFSQNGIAGIVFYVSVIAVACLSMLMGMSVPAAVGVFLIGLPLMLMLLKQPLSNILKRRKKLFDEGAGAYFAESIFEMLEVVLSYVTNTISFVRIGAFALVHAGMMSVVMTMAEMLGGTGEIIVFVLGNIFVMCLEAFLVGIQSLRLEFYEMFSRFFTGGGREFKPQKISK